MVSKLMDSIIYMSGAFTIGVLTFLWDKRIKIYDPNWRTTPIYRKVIFFKYGILPQEAIYQKSYDKLNWINTEEQDIKQLRNKPDLNFKLDDIDKMKITLSINEDKGNSEDTLKSSGFWSFIR
jgi:hypothetical protein